MNKQDVVDRIKSNFPEEIQLLHQWVVWRIEYRDDKPTKVPYSVSGLRAESDNPDTWTSFDVACSAYVNGNYSGVGFMFSEYDPYTGVDFDKCVSNGEIEPEKLAHIDFLDSYTEFSQSETGAHVIVKATLPPGGRKSIKHNTEMYDNKRFFVVTGNVFGGFPRSINERQPHIEHLHAQIFPAKQSQVQAQTVGHRNTQANAVDMNDEALLKRMFGSVNGAKIRSLYDGNRDGYDGDDSAADLALCNYLAFWTGNDEERIDRLFKQSGLYRAKWDRNARTGETYGEGTIARAIAGTPQPYNPQYTNGNGSNGHSAVNGLNGGAHSHAEQVEPENVSVNVTDTEDEPTETDDDTTWPYCIENGRMMLQKYVKDKETKENVLVLFPLADFWAKIVGESTDEEGNRYFTIAGHGIRGGDFKFEISASKYGDGRELNAALEGHVGAYDPIYAGMGSHMVPAIKKLTDGELIRSKTYHRTGWADGTFLIPGRAPEGVEIRLPRKLPYQIEDGDLSLGLQALDSLIQFMGPENGTVVISTFLLAPLALKAGWRNERFSLFIKGRTGTQKTATASSLMCMYGKEFSRDDMLLKFGEGATRNAIMQYATNACDMPMLIDNFKPSTGGGVNDFTNLIHNILEGGEKERLNRNSQLKETRPIFSWPICTGEDLPSNDPASIARIMVVTFDAKKRGDISHLSDAQTNAHHLQAIGKAWIEWLETNESQEIINVMRENLPSVRDAWAKKLTQMQPTMVNPYRVATNLATNQITLMIAGMHPSIGKLFEKYTRAHENGLTQIAREMASYTASSLEAMRFVESLREQLSGGRLLILPNKDAAAPTHATDNDRMIGWYTEDGSAFVYPELTIELVKRFSNDELGGITRNALYDQLMQLEMIASHDPNKNQKTVKVRGKSQKMLHLSSATFGTDDNS